MDRAVATCDWCIKFAQAKLFHRTSSASDHSPLVLQIFSKKQRKEQGKLFHFEAMWLEENTYEEVVISAWEEGLLLDSEFPILQCMEHCRTKLDIWNKNVFGHVGNNIARLH